jgi:hypothetical protein
MFVYFCVLHYFSYILPSLANDTHILGLAHVVPFAFNHFGFSWLLWGWSFNFTSVQLGPLLACFMGLPSQLVFVAPLMTLGS